MKCFGLAAALLAGSALAQGLTSPGLKSNGVPSSAKAIVAPVAAVDSNGATLSNGNFAQEYADGTHPGIVSTSAQTFAGAKSFSSSLLPSGNFAQDLGGSSNIWNNVYLNQVRASSYYDPANAYGMAIGAGAGNAVRVFGNDFDGATAVGVTLDNSQTLANAGARLVSIRNSGSEKAYFDKNGSLTVTPGATNLTVSAGSVAQAGGSDLNITTASGSINITATGGSVKAGGSPVLTSSDWALAAQTNQATGSGVIQKITVTNAGTYRSSNFATDVTGVGGGNFVLKLCSDGATCASGNTFTTCTVACAASADTNTTCTAGSATTYSAGATLSLSISTACATTNQIGTFLADLTTP